MLLKVLSFIPASSRVIVHMKNIHPGRHGERTDRGESILIHSMVLHHTLGPII